MSILWPLTLKWRKDSRNRQSFLCFSLSTFSIFLIRKRTICDGSEKQIKDVSGYTAVIIFSPLRKNVKLKIVVFLHIYFPLTFLQILFVRAPFDCLVQARWRFFKSPCVNRCVLIRHHHGGLLTSLLNSLRLWQDGQG